MKTLHVLPLIAAALMSQAAAQTWDTSGNGLLRGNYYFRHLTFTSFAANGSIGKRTAVYGTINFDGLGKYSINGQIADTGTSGTQPYTVTGTYGIGPHGYGFVQSPLIDDEEVVGFASRGVFVGSSTEGQINDLFVAVAAGSVNNSAFQGRYWLASMDFPSSDPTQVRDAMFSVTANGNGGFSGAINAAGYIGSSSSTVNQSISNLAYSFTNNVGTLTFPASSSQTLVSGSKTFYLSPDGNFLVGGSNSGYDLIVGVRATSGSVSNALYKGLYYSAGIDVDNSESAAFFDSYYTAANVDGIGSIVRDDRLAPFDDDPYDFTFQTFYSLNPDGTIDRPAFRYAVANSGLGLIGIGKAPVTGIAFGVKAPDFVPSGVFLNPTGIVNAASSAPFTTGISRGELITLYGSNLAPSTVVASSLPFPTTLNNVQVKINGRLAPIYFVSDSQISVVVPFATELSFATIQVINNGVASNSVTVVVNQTTPGIFSLPPGGVGEGAVLHANYSVVSASNPARVGETLQVFLTGLGNVTPPVTEGTAAPSNPLSRASNTINVYIDGIAATTTYVGLAPGLAGLYQINVTVPAGVTSGDVYIDIESINPNGSRDAQTSQVTIRVQ